MYKNQIIKPIIINSLTKIENLSANMLQNYFLIQAQFNVNYEFINLLPIINNSSLPKFKNLANAICKKYQIDNLNALNFIANANQNPNTLKQYINPISTSKLRVKYTARKIH